MLTHSNSTRFSSVARRPKSLSVVEPLEARIAPATITFQGNLPGGTYSWHSGASWVGGIAPGLGDDVIINAANRSMVVTITQPISVNSITMAIDETLSISSSLNVGATSLFGGVTVSGSGSFSPNGLNNELTGILTVGGGAWRSRGRYL